MYRAWKDSPKLVNCMGLGDIGIIGSTYLLVGWAQDQPPTHHEGQEQNKSANYILAPTRECNTKDPIDSLQKDLKRNAGDYRVK